MRTFHDEGSQHRFRTGSGLVRIYDVLDDHDVPVRVMDVKGTYQSATYHGDRYCDLPFLYFTLFDHLFEAPLEVRRVLMLGGGGCSYPKHLIRTRPDVTVDVVERDPMVISLARRWFYVDRLIEEYDLEENGRLHLICDDARSYLADEGPAYDVVINDAFSGRKAPATLAGPDAAAAVKARMEAGGLYLTSLISAGEGRQAKPLKRYLNALFESFERVWVLPCGRTAPDEVDNNVVIASDGDYRFSGAVTPTWLS